MKMTSSQREHMGMALFGCPSLRTVAPKLIRSVKRRDKIIYPRGKAPVGDRALKILEATCARSKIKYGARCALKVDVPINFV